MNENRTRSRALYALYILLVICLGLIELSQLYHTPWLDGLRSNRVGALALGRGFLWSDLACYAVGVACGVCVDLITSHSRSRPVSN